MRHKIISTVDLMMALLGALALVYTFVFGFMLVTHALGEFGDTSCACEDLQARLETVDWTGSGTGLRFEFPEDQ